MAPRAPLSIYARGAVAVALVLLSWLIARPILSPRAVTKHQATRTYQASDSLQCNLAANNVYASVSASSFRLFGAVWHRESNAPKGVFLSPLSVVYALTLAANGAGPQSATHEELLRAIASAPKSGHDTSAALSTSPSNGAGSNPLCFHPEADVNRALGEALKQLNRQGQPSKDRGGGAGGGGGGGGGLLQQEQEEVEKGEGAAKFVVADSVWTKRGTQLRKEYVQAMQETLNATAREAVNGAKDINDWVAGVTQGMIKDLVTSNDFNAILANAIYFKGEWVHPFKPTDTSDRDFLTASGTTTQVKMMRTSFRRHVGVQHTSRPGSYFAIGLPYKGGAFQAVAVLPERGVGMEAVLRLWATEEQEFVPTGRLDVYLPKFRVDSSMSLTHTLQQLGVREAFKAHAADFSRLSEQPLFISDVVHKVVVDVDELGTEAAAATAVMMLTSALLEPEEPPPQIVFDRPFLFLIQHLPTGLPAFVGVVNDPSV